MPKTLLAAFVCVLLLGCKPNQEAVIAPPVQPAYFKTPFQDETRFIVESILSDISQQMYYAVNQRAPDLKSLMVSAVEPRGNTNDTLTYHVEVRWDTKTATITNELKIDDSVWSPATYRSVVSQLAAALGLQSSQSRATPESNLADFSDCLPETIVKADQVLSLELEKNFRDAQLHERAALLLGLFAFRDHSGHFYDIRIPLSRMTAHLAMARFFEGADSNRTEGQLAEATLLTLINNQSTALARLSTISTNNPSVASTVRALQCRATGDFRQIGQLKQASRMERVEYFCSRAGYADSAFAWKSLTEDERQAIDFVRTANQRFSVEMGHELLRSALSLELTEVKTAYELTHQSRFAEDRLVDFLNEVPEGAFTKDEQGQTHFQVLGWREWAWFLQRHLCHAIQQNYRFLAAMLGDPEDAKRFAADCGSKVEGLRLYPFVRRFNCSTVEAYHKSVDDGQPVTVSTPQLVPTDCWNYLTYSVSFAPFYFPVPNPHLNEWFRHDPPPGTVYEVGVRLHHPSLTHADDSMARLMKLHEMAPWDLGLSRFILQQKYPDGPTYDQALAIYAPVLPYSVAALRTVAGTLRAKPAEYEKMMLQAAELDPACKYDLADFCIHEKQEEQAARYLDEACDGDADAVRAAGWSVWRVEYFLKAGQVEKARHIADEAAEVYSARGLEAKALFMEETTNYNAAFEWFSKMEERYDQSGPLLGFCLRYQNVTKDQRFAPEVEKRINKLFPKGVEKVAITNLHAAPLDGVVLRQQNDALAAAGLNAGDVIVAVYGVRVHNSLQYLYGREQQKTPELELIVWQRKGYREVKPSLPNHRFGVPIDDYVATHKTPAKP